MAVNVLIKRSVAVTAQSRTRSSEINWKGLEVIGMDRMKVKSRKSQWTAVDNR